MVEAAGTLGSNPLGGRNALGGADPVGGAERATPQVGERLGGAERAEIGRAVDGVGAERVVGAAKGITNGDVGDALADTGKGAAVGALQYGRIDPTNGRGINGGTYTDKVQSQMRQSPVTGAAADRHHGFPSAVDDAARGARSQPFVSGDGKIRSLVEVPGAVNGKAGNFEYITNRDGSINHRTFMENGRATVPEGARIPGTGALRALGRVAAPIGIAADVYDVANSPTPVKTAVEKAAGWGGAAASAGIVGTAAAPLLAGGVPGAIGYGAAVIGAGAIGYFGGEAAARRVMGWFGL